MTNKLSGIWGTIAAVTVILFGGWSGAVIGWLLGTAVGFTRCWDRRVLSPQAGAQLGGRSGLTIGFWLLGASILQGFIAPILGQPRVSLIQIILQGIVALGVTTVSAAVMGALQGLSFDRRRLATLVTFAFVLVLFPFVDGLAKTSWLPTAILILIFVMLALGLNITVGFAGLLDLGYAAFFAIGAYTTGFLSSPQLGNSWNFWLVLPIAAGVAGIFGVILGSPTLRLRGDYLAIVTLGFGEIVPVVFRNLTDLQINEPISSIFATLLNRPDLAICWVGCETAVNLTGGEAGINPIGRPMLPIIGTFDSTDYFPWYYLILALAVGSFWAISRLKDSRLGRAWEAIREDELAASAMGINRVKTKLLAFAMGATFSGFAGSFYAAYLSAIFPSVFDFSVSVIILCMVILGGLGNMRGVVLGSIIIMAADRLYLPQLAQVLKSFLNTAVLPNLSNPQLRDFISTSLDPIQMRLFLFGLTLVIMMIVRPEGLLPDAIHRAELHSEDEENNDPLTPERSS